MKKKYLLLLEEKINYYLKALCVLIFRLRFVFPEAFMIAYASLPKSITLRFADYTFCSATLLEKADSHSYAEFDQPS